VAEIGVTDSKQIAKLGLHAMHGVVNDYVTVESHVSLKDIAAVTPPEHLPEDVLATFKEGAKCLSVDCFNAAGTMFRLCIDKVTRSILPEGEIEGLNAKVRRDLGLRLPWLFDHKFLPDGLRDLSHCIKEDGNDGAHQGTLQRVDAEDLLDFTVAVLERVYTEPRKIQLAKERREVRRAQ
jgi:hypothetical protein